VIRALVQECKGALQIWSLREKSPVPQELAWHEEVFYRGQSRWLAPDLSRRKLDSAFARGVPGGDVDPHESWLAQRKFRAVVILVMF
jgi:hypothetical protein